MRKQGYRRVVRALRLAKEKEDRVGKSQRTKGHGFERKVAQDFNESFPGCEARRGIQTRFGGKDAGDVVSKLPFHVECKVGKKPNPREAMRQARGDANHGQMPVCVIKDDRCKPFVVMGYDDWRELVAEVWRSWDG